MPISKAIKDAPILADLPVDCQVYACTPHRPVTGRKTEQASSILPHLWSANGAATYQPGLKAQEKGQKKRGGLKALNMRTHRPAMFRAYSPEDSTKSLYPALRTGLPYLRAVGATERAKSISTLTG